MPLFFTRKDNNPNYLTPATLSNVLWHELEHLAHPDVAFTELPPLRAAYGRTAVAAVYAMQDEFGRIARAQGGFAAVGQVGSLTTIEGVDLCFKEYATRRMHADEARQAFVLPAGTPSALLPYLNTMYAIAEKIEAINARLEEDPDIARTSKAMKRLYHEPTRYSHGGIESPALHNPVNSGTLSPEAQAKEDAKYATPMSQITLPPALLKGLEKVEAVPLQEASQTVAAYRPPASIGKA